MTIAAAFLAEFNQEMANTRKMLECVPDDALDYQPHPKSMTMARLVGHIAEMPDWGTNTVQLDELDLNPPGGAAHKPFIAESRSHAVDFFDRGVAKSAELIGTVPDDAMRTDWTLKMAGRPIFTMPRIAVLKSMILNHIIHHRAQLSVYLRMNDIPIPGMYGPSADDR